MDWTSVCANFRMDLGWLNVEHLKGIGDTQDISIEEKLYGGSLT